jgi:cell division GTPase FtsZ
MTIALRGLRAAVRAALSGRPGPAPEPPEVAAAARLLAEVVQRDGRLIEIEAHDVVQILAEWPDELAELYVLVADGPRADLPTLPAWLAEARAALVEVVGGPDLTLVEVAAVSDALHARMPADVELVFGASVSPAAQGQLGLRLVALAPASP